MPGLASKARPRVLVIEADGQLNLAALSNNDIRLESYETHS